MSFKLFISILCPFLAPFVCKFKEKTRVTELEGSHFEVNLRCLDFGLPEKHSLLVNI